MSRVALIRRYEKVTGGVPVGLGDALNVLTHPDVIEYTKQYIGEFGQSEVPDPVDLSVLSDRARAYIMGLEAKLRERREENERLRDQLSHPDRVSEAVEKKVREAYFDGFRDASMEIVNSSGDLKQLLEQTRARALVLYNQSYGRQRREAEGGPATP